MPCPPASKRSKPRAASAATRRIGAVKAINGAVITLTPDTGPDLSVTVQATTRILRIAPGEKDLKNATPIQLQDLQVGDRILVAGKASDDNLSLAASTVVVMKHSDLEARHQQDLQDWQKRGVDGLAKAVDPAAGTVTISVRSKDVVIHTSSNTVIRRYAPDSVKFDDAKTGTLQQIHPGDQVRARGDRSADGGELAADEIVSGSFPGIAGTVNSVRCKFVDSQRSRFVVEENGGYQDHSGLAASSSASGNGADDCSAFKRSGRGSGAQSPHRAPALRRTAKLHVPALRQVRWRGWSRRESGRSGGSAGCAAYAQPRAGDRT